MSDQALAARLAELELAHRELALREARLRAVMDAEPASVTVIAVDGTLVDANPAGLRMLEATALDQVKGRSVAHLVVEESRVACRQMIEGVLRGEPGSLELECLGLEGGRHWLETHAAPLRDASGSVTAIVSVARDITERRRAEQALAESESLRRSLLESVQEGIHGLDAAGNVMFENRASLAMLGWPAEDLVGRHAHESVHHHRADGSVYPVGECAIYRTLADGETRRVGDEVFFRRDGTSFPVEYTCCAMRDASGAITGVVVSFRDVSQRRADEERIRRLKRTYEVLSAIDQLLVRERDEAVILEAACRIAVEKGGFVAAWASLRDDALSGWRLAAATGVAPDTREIVEAALRGPAAHRALTEQAMETGQPAVRNDVAADPRAARWSEAALAHSYRSMVALPLVVSGRRIGVFSLCAGEVGFFDADEIRLLGELAADIGVALELGERERDRKRSEAALRASEERFREIAENIDEVFWITSADRSELLYMSPGWAKIWGRRDGLQQGSPYKWLRAAVHPDDRERVLRALSKPDSSGRHDEEYRIVRPDGEIRWVRDQAFPVRNAAGEVMRVVGVARDMTERHQLQEQVRRSQRIEATGQLAAGVAHDFNNLLTVILGGCEMARLSLDPSSPAAAELQQISDAATRGARLTQQLLAFTRQQAVSPRLVDLRQHLKSLEGMLRRTIPENVAIEWAIEDSRWPVWVDAAQVDQIVLNLAVNARDAMPRGGVLSLELADVTVGAAECARWPGLAPGDHVRLSVRDTGHGMDAATLDHVFEPFFTTKAAGQGTGLGLASVYGIVEQNRGAISLTSRPAEGTTVVIHLPRARGGERGERGEQGERETREVPGSTVSEPGRGRETVLLVEDNDAVRRMTRHFLERWGYRVLEAADGRAALALSDAHEGEIDLLLTDLVMPGMSGTEVAQVLLRRRPGLHTLFTSGYAPTGLPGTGGAVFGVDQYIQKPFALGALAKAVRRALETDRPRSGEGGPAPEREEEAPTR